MLLKRLKVEEGFLGGLDLELGTDLNVLIGGRGVGKTSVIELIRFCLGIQHLDSEMAADSREHVKGILEDGVVSLTVELDGGELTLTRSASSPPPVLPVSTSRMPIVLSQREIETLARTPKGRLSLLDSFLVKPAERDKLSEAKVRSISAEIRRLTLETEEAETQLRERSSLQKELDELRRQQAQIQAKAPATQALHAQIEEAQALVNGFAREDEALRQAELMISRWLEILPSKSQLEAISGIGEENVPENIRVALKKDLKLTQDLRRNANSYLAEISTAREAIRVKKEPVESSLRTARQTIETERAGAGKIVREISRVGEALARLESVSLLFTQKMEQIKAKHLERLDALEKVMAAREALYDLRQAAAKKLNVALHPNIKVTVEHSSGIEEYEQAILGLLKGSYLRYNELAPEIASAISPVELCELVHALNAEELARLLSISHDRAHRFLSAFREGPIEDVLLAPINDAVQFCLLDGATYKAVDELSIGQRCTVVLSIVFENLGVVLVVDQPEDHLDNEFVADTLIRAIRNRDLIAQTIVSTHNANIPVLGDASRVVHLESNGEVGFIKAAGPLTSSSVVAAIVSVMEGGEAAFNRRATFYGSGV